MDFIVLAGLTSTFLQMLVFSYDIVCQWSRNFRKRVAQFPPHMRLDDARLDRAVYKLPKFHILNHGRPCQVKYLPNYLKWSAWTNGEDPERFWAYLNPASMSTREMGEGSRKETTDDHIRSWNFRKIINFGTFYQVSCSIYLS